MNLVEGLSREIERVSRMKQEAENTGGVPWCQYVLCTLPVAVQQ